MATYKEIFGKTIKFLTSDPTDDGAVGQIWYNDTSDTFKSVVAGGAWSSVPPVSDITSGAGISGTAAACVKYGGQGASPHPILTAAEEFDGTGWSTATSVPAARYSWVGGIGIQTAALAASGITEPGPLSTDCFEYDGSSWTAGGSISTARCDAGGAGTQTAGLAMGGRSGAAGASANITGVEEYNGASWTAGTVMPAATDQFCGCGLQTAALQAGGDLTNDAAGINTTSEYDGSAWTSLPNLNTAGRGTGNSGITTSALCYSGASRTTATESFDGSSWTTSPATLAAGRDSSPPYTNSASNNQSAMAVTAPPYTAACEEFSVAATLITSAAWAAGGAMGTAGYNISGVGTQTAGLGFARYTATSLNNGLTEEYNGTGWSEEGDLATGRMDASGFGTQTAAVCAGGKQDPGSNVDNTEEYGGSSWTAGNVLPAARRGAAAFGILTAGVVAGGGIPGYTDTSLEYDGTNYSAGGTMNTARGDLAPSAAGTLTAGVVFGGREPAASDSTEEYNGTGWTTASNMIVAVTSNASAENAVQTAALSFGGDTNLATTYGYDGTTWTTRPSLGTSREKAGGFGIGTAAVTMGGEAGPTTGITTTEEFTSATTTLNYKTITTS
jgi:hypothetical protein|tara:strand:+ start:937 stop:2781 length:1845 start_codon:yes stop_codon:yes gene_type:complete